MFRLLSHIGNGSSGNDIVLNVLIKLHKEGRITGHPHKQPLIIFGMPLGVKKFLLIHNVELYMEYSQRAEPFQQAHHCGNAILAVKEIRHNLHVQQGTLHKTVMRYL